MKISSTHTSSPLIQTDNQRNHSFSDTDGKTYKFAQMHFFLPNSKIPVQEYKPSGFLHMLALLWAKLMGTIKIVELHLSGDGEGKRVKKVIIQATDIFKNLMVNDGVSREKGKTPQKKWSEGIASKEVRTGTYEGTPQVAIEKVQHLTDSPLAVVPVTPETRAENDARWTLQEMSRGKEQPGLALPAVAEFTPVDSTSPLFALAPTTRLSEGLSDKKDFLVMVKQLISGLGFMHAHDRTHTRITPENIEVGISGSHYGIGALGNTFSLEDMLDILCEARPPKTESATGYVAKEYYQSYEGWPEGKAWKEETLDLFFGKVSGDLDDYQRYDRGMISDYIDQLMFGCDSQGRPLDLEELKGHSLATARSIEKISKLMDIYQFGNAVLKPFEEKLAGQSLNTIKQEITNACLDSGASVDEARALAAALFNITREPMFARSNKELFATQRLEGFRQLEALLHPDRAASASLVEASLSTDSRLQTSPLAYIDLGFSRSDKGKKKRLLIGFMSSLTASLVQSSHHRGKSHEKTFHADIRRENVGVQQAGDLIVGYELSQAHRVNNLDVIVSRLAMIKEGGNDLIGKERAAYLAAPLQRDAFINSVFAPADKERAYDASDRKRVGELYDQYMQSDSPTREPAEEILKYAQASDASNLAELLISVIMDKPAEDPSNQSLMQRSITLKLTKDFGFEATQALFISDALYGLITTPSRPGRMDYLKTLHTELQLIADRTVL